VPTWCYSTYTVARTASKTHPAKMGAFFGVNSASPRTVFINTQVTRRLDNGLIRLHRAFHGALFACGRTAFRCGFTHRTHLLRFGTALVSVCPEEYSHIKVQRVEQKWRRKGNKIKVPQPSWASQSCTKTSTSHRKV
jgi:hypothetical protein